MSFPISLHDLSPDVSQFRDEVWAGLSLPQKSLPCKYFYDERGSALFESICELPEYYPTRTEVAIMEAHATEMAALLGDRCLLVEYGSGSSRKTCLLLDQLRDAAGYVPIDISRAALTASARALAAAYPRLEVLPVCADYTDSFELPRARVAPERRGVYFPGSTIGNFAPAEARKFLTQVAEICGPGGALLIGVDLKKSRRVLEPAYDDALGVTADFNLNLLRRLNRELGASFALDQFTHRALWNEAEGRVEMHLVSRRRQEVTLGGHRIRFEAGETIHTENSYKYDLSGFGALARSAGFEVERVWIDGAALFSVQALRVVS